MTRAEARAHLLAGGTLTRTLSCETHTLTAELTLISQGRCGLLTLRSSAHFPRAIGVTLAQVETFLTHYPEVAQ
jgi:hypothetical protein